MRTRAGHVLVRRRSCIALLLLLSLACNCLSQISNRVWVASYGGSPTPSSDVGILNLFSDGNGSAVNPSVPVDWLTQTNFTSFASPFDVAVDPAMGKVFVLDNNFFGGSPAYIYSFNLAGSPALVAASAQAVYTMPVPAADQVLGTTPLISGMALDSSNHCLYFVQRDVSTATNSFVGRLDLGSSELTDASATNFGSPLVHEFYVAGLPGQGAISLCGTNLCLGAINSSTGNAGLYMAPMDGSGSFQELVAVSRNDPSFTNGLIAGVLGDAADQRIYYLTWNAGLLNGHYDLSQNALWMYDLARQTNVLIASGFSGYPDNMAADFSNGRYYFTLGRDGTGEVPQTNHQAVYSGLLGSSLPPQAVFFPPLSGQDVNGSPNAGMVALQGVFVEDAPSLSGQANAIRLSGSAPTLLCPQIVAADPSSTFLSSASVVITGGSFAGDGDVLAASTNGTLITSQFYPASGTLVLAGMDSVAHYQQVLRTISFAGSSQASAGGQLYPSRSFNWTVSDGGMTSPPVSSSVTLINGPVPATNRLTAFFSGANLFLAFSGAPGQGYVLQSAPTPSGPWFGFQQPGVSDSDGLVLFQQAWTPSSAAQFYRAFHPPPSIVTLASPVYLAGTPPVALSPSLVLNVPSATPTLAGAMVSLIGQSSASSGDQLSALVQGTAIQSSFDPVQDVLTLSGVDSVADYQTALRSVSYSSTNINPSASGQSPLRTVNWTVSDGLTRSSPVQSSIYIPNAAPPGFNRLSLAPQGSGFDLLFSGVPDRNYIVQMAAFLNGPWTNLTTGLTANSSGLVFLPNLSFSNRSSNTASFYRVRSSP